METTAIYENRIKDKKELESEIPFLNEYGCEDICFTTPNAKIICLGYNRIVFGDHGPYIEFLKEHVILDQWKCHRKGIGYYDKYYPIDKSHILLYAQRKDVKNLPNPPKGKRSFNGNRKEGYADYVIGRYYISPYERDLLILNRGKIINKFESSLKDIL